MNAMVETEVRSREVERLVKGVPVSDGAGVKLLRVLTGDLQRRLDPFLMLDEFRSDNPEDYLAGFPNHPHRGFETVTYIIDGTFEHADSYGGGGTITNGATQWMTAGSGILHIEAPPEELVASGGLFHGLQLWVNLPRRDKLANPRYQDLKPTEVALLSSPDGGALVRVIAGELAGHQGPGNTHTPITMAHATLAPGARLDLPWGRDFNALVYAMGGSGTVGPSAVPLRPGQLAVLGEGDAITVTADATQESRYAAGLDLVILGGAPIREPIAWAGPFVMNTRAELVAAVEDYRAGRLGHPMPAP